MYVVLSYDVEAKRVGKARRICLKYPHARHRSVYEGELTEMGLRDPERELAKVVEPGRDRVCVWRMAGPWVVSADELGLVDDEDNVILGCQAGKRVRRPSAQVDGRFWGERGVFLPVFGSSGAKRSVDDSRQTPQRVYLGICENIDGLFRACGGGAGGAGKAQPPLAA